MVLKVNQNEKIIGGFFLDFCFEAKTCRVKIVKRKNDILHEIIKNCSSKMINNALIHFSFHQKSPTKLFEAFKYMKNGKI